MRTWSTPDVARIAGVSARTLRHYDAIGLLTPVKTGHGGLRHYGQAQLLRLQQILLLRRLGLRLETVGEILDGGMPAVEALRRHAEHLTAERDRIDRLTDTVDATIRQLEGGQPMAPETWFDGLDAHRPNYEDEARRLWGDDAIDRANRVVSEMSETERASIPREFESLNERLAAKREAGLGPGDDEVQAIVADHHRLMARMWDREPDAEAYKGLGSLYGEDPRYTKSDDEDGRAFAAYWRDAIHHWADANL